MSLLKSLLSYAWPVTEWRGNGQYGPLTVVWEQGHLVVNSARANQGYGNLHAVWQQCLHDLGVRQRPIQRILLLGFGAGNSARILRREFGLQAPITGVDGDGEILRIAREHFHINRLKDVQLVLSDALVFARTHPLAYDLVLVDLFHELDLAPHVDEAPFITDLHRCTTPGGLLCFNTIGHDADSARRSQRTGLLLRQHFSVVHEHVYQGINRVFSATHAPA